MDNYWKEGLFKFFETIKGILNTQTPVLLLEFGQHSGLTDNGKIYANTSNDSSHTHFPKIILDTGFMVPVSKYMWFILFYLPIKKIQNRNISLFRISKRYYFMKKMKYGGFVNKLFHTIHQMIEKIIGNRFKWFKELNYQSHHFWQIHFWKSNNSCIFIYYEFLIK